MNSKRFIKIARALISPFSLGTFVTIVMTIICFKYYMEFGEGHTSRSTFYGILRQLHDKSTDFRMKDRGPKQPNNRIAILTIDEKAVEQEGRWPWPRNKTALTVEKTLGYGAKIIAFDMIFSEEEKSSSLPALLKLKEQFANQLVLAPQIDQTLKAEIDNAQLDRAFSETIKKNADHLVLGSFFEEFEDQTDPPTRDLCRDPLFKRSPAYKYWNNEQINITVIDSKEMRLPDQWNEHLTQYFTKLELSEVDSWFTANPEKLKNAENAIKGLGLEVDSSLVPIFTYAWLSADLENLTSQLAQGAPPTEQLKTQISKLPDTLSKVIDNKDQITLAIAMRSKPEAYCHRFLSIEDELLNENAYTNFWGESESFKDWSIAAKWSDFSQADSHAKTLTLDQYIGYLQHKTLENPVLEIAKWVLNIPLFRNVTKHSGYFNAQLDPDGTIRHSRLIARRGNSYMPSIAFKSFLIDKGFSTNIKVDGESVAEEDQKSKAVTSFEVLNENGDPVMKIPVDGQGRVSINYHGGKEMFPHISAADVLSDKPTAEITQTIFNDKKNKWESTTLTIDKKDFLKDKILFFGATATGIYDLRVTPFEENFPGVETHANVLANLFAEYDLAINPKKPPFGLPLMKENLAEHIFMPLILFVVGIALSFLFSHTGSIPGLLITGGALFCVYLIDRFILFEHGTLVVVLFPITLICLLFVTLSFYKYFTEERKKRELKGTFEKYVSPAIVQEVLADPSNIELGGRKMEMSVFFSDVRGFTTISEKLDPRALSDLLNSYLTPMTELVFANKGTLDKYMGDAIMAFFGAPIASHDHAENACRCALQHITKLKELQQQYRSQGLPEIDIGIGINTGEMSVGNMGSQTVRNYTVMGDNVNLGSRLEGINKQYGTRIIISEFTQAAIQDKFITREIDWVKVKGKLKPVRIFELMAEKSVEPKVQEMLKHYNQGFQLYHERKFDFAIKEFEAALAANPEDKVSKLYIHRCEYFISEPPPQDWDGVIEMKEK